MDETPSKPNVWNIHTVIFLVVLITAIALLIAIIFSYDWGSGIEKNIIKCNQSDALKKKLEVKIAVLATIGSLTIIAGIALIVFLNIYKKEHIKWFPLGVLLLIFGSMMIGYVIYKGFEEKAAFNKTVIGGGWILFGIGTIIVIVLTARYLDDKGSAISAPIDLT